MSEDRAIDIPPGTKTQQLVQYGLRWPNGEIDWAAESGALKLKPDKVGVVSNFNIHPKYRKDKYTNGIETITAWNLKLIQAAGLDPAEYVAPVLIKRAVILITLDPEDVIE
jgi:hypothetical protein